MSQQVLHLLENESIFLVFVFIIDGQAVAKKLCSQITKTTNAVKQLIKQYERGDAASRGCRYPWKVNLQEALDISSSLWATLDDSNLFVGVPYCIKQQIIDFKGPFSSEILCSRLFLFWNRAIVKWRTLIGRLL